MKKETNQEITVTISGFKTIKEAQRWVDAYEGGVEQDMATWAEADGEENAFPSMTDKITKTTKNNINLHLR